MIAEAVAEVGVPVAIAFGLIETLKYTIGKLSGSKGFTPADHEMLSKLERWHAPDESGMQVWKNWGATEARDDLREMVALQKRSLETLNRIEQQGRPQ